MPNSRSALHGERPSLIHGLCAFFASNSRFMSLFQAALDTCLDSPLFYQPLSSRFALHGLRTLDRPPRYHKKDISRPKKGCTYPPPPLPPFWPAYFEPPPPQQEFYTPPPSFIRPPSLEGYFQGWGGGV